MDYAVYNPSIAQLIYLSIRTPSGAIPLQSLVNIASPLPPICNELIYTRMLSCKHKFSNFSWAAIYHAWSWDTCRLQFTNQFQILVQSVPILLIPSILVSAGFCSTSHFLSDIQSFATGFTSDSYRGCLIIFSHNNIPIPKPPHSLEEDEEMTQLFRVWLLIQKTWVLVPATTW